MALLRIIALCLPQLLAAMLVGATFDLLGGWNHTHAGFGTLLVLFLVTPVAVLCLLVAELVRYFKVRRKNTLEPALFWPGVALCLCAESLGINLLILLQVQI